MGGDEGREDGEESSRCEERSEHDDEGSLSFLSYIAKLFGRDGVQAIFIRTLLIRNEQTEDLKQRWTTTRCKNRSSAGGR